MEAVAAWKTPYKGNSANLFAKVLKNAHSKELKHLSNYIPICQSSGMGKSRMVDEAAKQILTIPICLWNGGGRKSPVEDTSARVELSNISNIADKEKQTKAFYHFFEVIFVAVEKQISNSLTVRGRTPKEKLSYTELARCWREYLEDGDARNRKALFHATTDSHSKVLTDDDSKDVGQYSKRLRNAVKNLITRIKGLTSEKKPLILISIDEIDSVITSRNLGGKISSPIFLNMLRALYAEYLPSVMVTCLSTFGYVFDIAPTSDIIEKALTLKNVALQPIFIELPFDVHAGPISESQLLEEFCDVKILSTYGRPLLNAAYDTGDKEKLVYYAAERLANGTVSASLRLFEEDLSNNRFGIADFNSSGKRNAVAAFFNIRFLLYSQTYRVLPPIDKQEQVASHFYTIRSIPLHRQYMHCVHPPEPILAEAAAHILEVPKNMGKIIEISSMMFDTILTGSTERGPRGEYAARLILMAAHDRAVLQQTLAPNATTDDQLKYTRPVKVVDFLQ